VNKFDSRIEEIDIEEIEIYFVEKIKTNM